MARKSLNIWFGVEREINRSTDSVISKLLAAKSQNKPITIEYRRQGRVTPQERVISVLKLFTSEKYGHTYVRGMCHQIDEQRVFRLDRLSLAGKTSSSGKTKKQGSGKSTSRKGKTSGVGRATKRIVSKSAGRGKCKNKGCENLVAYKGRRVDGSRTYRLVCNSCHTKGYSKKTIDLVRISKDEKQLAAFNEYVETTLESIGLDKWFRRNILSTLAADLPEKTKSSHVADILYLVSTVPKKADEEQKMDALVEASSGDFFASLCDLELISGKTWQNLVDLVTERKAAVEIRSKVEAVFRKQGGATEAVINSEAISSVFKSWYLGEGRFGQKCEKIFQTVLEVLGTFHDGKTDSGLEINFKRKGDRRSTQTRVNPVCSRGECDNLVDHKRINGKIEYRKTGTPVWDELCPSCKKLTSGSGKAIEEKTAMPTSFEQSKKIDHMFMEDRLDEFREKLLDFSRRNPLINFNHSSRSHGYIRVVDEVPDQLLAQLNKDEMFFKPLPGLDEDPADEKTDEFELNLANAKATEAEYLEAMEALDGNDDLDTVAIEEQSYAIERALRNRVREEMGLPELQTGPSANINLRAHARIHGFNPDYDLDSDDESPEHSDDRMQTLLMPNALQKRLVNVNWRHTSHIRETGINVLQMAFGFLEWTQSTGEGEGGEEKKYLSPLVLLPVSVTRDKTPTGYVYAITSESGQATRNETLFELFNSRGIELPEFEGDEQEQESIRDYLIKVEKMAQGRPGWRIRRFVTLGVFPFSTIAMYGDLFSEKWGDQEITSHEDLAKLVGGKDADSGGFMSTEENIDKLTIDSEAPPLLLSADSSQHSAIYEALKGKSLVIQGPPGTGKSQTIANLIAAAMCQGKNVLFLAEKQPALDVVAARLKDAGLGPLLLEPRRGSGADKLGLVSALKERLELIADDDGKEYEKAKKALVKEIEFSNQIKSLLDVETVYCGFSFYKLVWENLNLKRRFSADEALFEVPTRVKKISSSQLERVRELIELYFEIEKPRKGTPNLLLHVNNLEPNAISVDGFAQAVNVLRDAASRVVNEIDVVRSQGLLLDYETFYLVDEQLSQARELDVKDEVEGIEKTIELIDSVRLEGERLSVLTSSLNGWPENLDSFQAVDKALEAVGLTTVVPAQAIEEKKTLITNVDLLLRWKNILDEQDLAFPSTPKAMRVLSAVVSDVGKLHALEEHLKRDFDDASIDTTEFKKTLDATSDRIKTLKKKIRRIKSNVDLNEILKKTTASEIKVNRELIEQSGFFGGLKSNVREARRFFADLEIGSKEKGAFSADVDALLDALQLAVEMDDDVETERLLGSIYEGPRTATKQLNSLSKDLAQYKSLKQKIARLAKVPGSDVTALHVRTLVNSIDEKLGTGDFSSQERDSEIATVLENQRVRINLADVLEQQIPMDKRAEKLIVGQLADSLNSKQQATVQRDGFLAEIEQHNLPVGLTLREMEELSEKKLTIFARLNDFLSTEINLSELQRILAIDLTALRVVIPEFQKALETFSETYEPEENFFSGDAPRQVVSSTENIYSSTSSELVLDMRRKSLGVEIRNSIVPELFSSINRWQSDDIEGVFRRLKLALSTKILAEFAREYSVDLTKITGREILRSRGRYANADKELHTLEARRALALGKARPIPAGNSTGLKRTWTDAALIRNEIGKKKAHLAMRQLFQRASGALLGMKPAWLMQPLSVSQFLPKRREIFDLVIIDEASQMLPENAAPSIIRGKQLIVVGDDQQMPPSNYFNVTIDHAGEDAPEVESESILDLANQRLGKGVGLNWHYRSRDPSLIRFSNHHLYNNRLRLFPSPKLDDESIGISHVKVDGRFVGGVNLEEAKRVVIEAKKCMAQFPDQSIGIVAMNLRQRDHIEEELRRLADTDSIVREYFDKWQDEILDYPFVKNLERVQGDERDTIIISTVYGRDENGTPNQRFPLINTVHGHRRLNVLFTRAKHRIVLITSMTPADIRLDDSSHKGKRLLRDYIEYCATGTLSTATDGGAQPDSEFEEYVIDMLRNAGYEAIPQVGVEGFRIDIGVKHPDYPYGYIAGIECDGATYHSSPQARDRDRIRQDILEGLGWRIYRIWSTDWFSDSADQTKNVLEYLSQIRLNLQSKVVSTKPVGLREEEEVQTLRPTGRKDSIEVDDVAVDFYERHGGSYEVWSEDTLLGWVEKDIRLEAAQRNYGQSIAQIDSATFLASLKSSDVTVSLKTLQQAVRWVYKQGAL